MAHAAEEAPGALAGVVRPIVAAPPVSEGLGKSQHELAVLAPKPAERLARHTRGAVALEQGRLAVPVGHPLAQVLGGGFSEAVPDDGVGRESEAGAGAQGPP